MFILVNLQFGCFGLKVKHKKKKKVQEKRKKKLSRADPERFFFILSSQISVSSVFPFKIAENVF